MQSVVGFKSRCGLASGSQFLQGLLLNEKIGLNVAMRSLNVLMVQHKAITAMSTPDCSRWKAHVWRLCLSRYSQEG